MRPSCQEANPCPFTVPAPGLAASPPALLHRTPLSKLMARTQHVFSALYKIVHKSVLNSGHTESYLELHIINLIYEKEQA